MDYLSHNIAINLKRIRKAKAMSLDVVAEQTGVSKSMLATIEKGDANPSIGVLGKIMSGLRVDLQDLTQVMCIWWMWKIWNRPKRCRANTKCGLVFPLQIIGW